METSEKPIKNSRKRFVIFTVTAFALLFAAIGGLLIAQKLQQEETYRQYIIQSPYFHEGIVVNGVPLGGLRMQEAREAVEATNAKTVNSLSCSLYYGGQSYTLTGKDLGLQFNTEDILNQAFSLGRTGSYNELQEELLDISTNQRTYYTTYTLSEAAVAQFIENLSKRTDQLPQDATFATLIDPKAASPEERKKEAYVNAAATTKREDWFTMMPHQDGRQLDQGALYKALMEMGAAQAFEDMELPMIITQAAHKLEDIQGSLVLRGSAYTSFAKSPYNRSTRVFNIKKAVGCINGTVLQPGEVFSTNDALGYRTYNNGWKPAPAIVGGRTEDQAGGGVCQVSTTMYNCVLKSGMEIVYRQGHSGRLSYVGGGLDATIDSGRIDFTWKNNTNSPVYLFAYVDEKEKKVHFELYGEPFPEEYDEIQLSSKMLSGLSPSGSMQYTVDYSKPAGYSKVYVARKSGSIWESYATYLKNGNVVKTITIAKTRYNAYAGETIVGPSSTAVYAGG